MIPEETAKRLRTKLKRFVGSLQEDERQLLGGLLDAPWDLTDVLDEWGRNVRELQELQMSFNLQYLQLQQKMQDESRRFTLLLNVMKTKHDAVKNSISNVR
jgi:hypothetical protein